MKKHKKIIIIIIIVALIIAIATFFIIKNMNTSSFDDNRENMRQTMKNNMTGNVISNTNQVLPEEDIFEKVFNKNQTTTLKSSAEVKSALTENVELHATYYLEEVLVEENQFVAEGENILKYTNGTYLVAPYDCYIVQLNLPELEEKALNSHYVQISSSNSLMVTMNVDETYINNITIGLEATIEVTSLGKKYTGYITHIASSGNNGKFEIEIEFENDGNTMIGMSSEVSITI